MANPMSPDGQTYLYVFDAYGTLFDVHSAVARHSGLVGPDAARLSEIWRTKQLEYSWVRAAMGRYRDFWQLTAEALDFAIKSVPGIDRKVFNPLMEAYETLDCYEEVPSVLATLRDRGARTAILSNGSPRMLQCAAKSAGIDGLLDAVLSVDEIATFKTMPQVYELVTNTFSCVPGDVMFQSSNRWDIAGATAFGFTCNWINRTRQPEEYSDLPPVTILDDLNGLLI